jgi:hypothetical protein
MEGLDIRHDSNLYLQEYISSMYLMCYIYMKSVWSLFLITMIVRFSALENLPSEIQYHWTEIQKRNEQLEGIDICCCTSWSAGHLVASLTCNILFVLIILSAF